jgi:hypothetical protein
LNAIPYESYLVHLPVEGFAGGLAQGSGTFGKWRPAQPKTRMLNDAHLP